MKFEENPVEGYMHGLVFQASKDEVEAVGAAYRERIVLQVKASQIDQITLFDRNVSEWECSSDQTIYINYPLVITGIFEAFHNRTVKSVKEIASRSNEPAFDNDDIARRIRLGDKAFQLAGLIKLEYEQDTLHQMLDDFGTFMFTPSPRP